MCGNGKRIYDKCDDNNRVKNDGCNSNCQIETGNNYNLLKF